MHNDEEVALREKIGQMLADGLQTQTEPFPETHREFGELLAELRELPPDDLEGKLVLSGFADKPYGPDQMRCLECMFTSCIANGAICPNWLCRLSRNGIAACPASKRCTKKP